MLAAGGEGPVLRLWDVRSGRSLGELPREGQRLTPANVERLHGHLGFRARRHPYRASVREGYQWIEPDDPALPTFRVAADGPLIADPTGTYWASPAVHVALEHRA